MIDVLGIKRIFILLVLAALNLILLASVYGYLQPANADKSLQLRRVSAKVKTLEAEVADYQVEFSQLTSKQQQFDELKDSGFFSEQGRREAQAIFERIQSEANVISATANIQPGILVDDAEAAKADHRILKSDITVRIEAFDDVDVFRYLYLIEHFFPGHVVIKSMTMERTMNVNGTILRAIASNSNPILVRADIDMVWRTMIPVSNVSANAEGGQSW